MKKPRKPKRKPAAGRHRLAPPAADYRHNREPAPPGRHRARGRKLTSKPGRHRAPERVPPWSELYSDERERGYRGAHRDPTPTGSPGRHHRPTVKGPYGHRMTPANDRLAGASGPRYR